ncbi:NAC domain-containing protein 96-like [Rosa sericea]
MDNGGHDDHVLPGQRFVPMEDELLLCYLKPMVHGKQVPGRDLVVFDCDLYGDQEPWEIWETYKTRRANDLRKNKDLYFFTQQKKKTPKDSRVGRTVGRGGTWKEESGKKVISPETNRVIGYKKTFGYKNQGSPHEGCWIMHEFELDPSQLIHRKQETNYVLCVLRKKKEPEINKRKRREQMPGYNSVLDDGTNLISKQPKQESLVPSTSNAPPPPIGLGAEQGEREQCLQPPCINNPNAQTVPLPYTFPSEENRGVQQFAAGEQYWGQQFVVPSGDDQKRNFSEREEKLWQQMVADLGTTPHPHTSSMRSTYI